MFPEDNVRHSVRCWHTMFLRSSTSYRSAKFDVPLISDMKGNVTKPGFNKRDMLLFSVKPFCHSDNLRSLRPQTYSFLSGPMVRD
jgi:hypothetical protein